jgi:cell division septum initiation protein DivIVA
MVLRGYDPGEVDRTVASLREELDRIRGERDRLAARLAEVGDRDLQAEFEAISREVGEVLEAARQAADALRQRAAADAARWRSEAIAEAEVTRRQARADAEQLRGDAWTTAEELLGQSQREARRIVDEAEQEALRRVGEAEREAHRLIVNARREAEDLVRAAKMEADRLVSEASSRHDEIIETARRQAEVAQERTRALEQRRDELKRELESVREALAAMEVELDERRERLGLSVESQERPPEPHWEPGETVRVVRANESPATGEMVLEGEEVEPEELGPEIRVLSAEEVRKRRGEETPPAPLPPEEQPVAEEPADTHFEAEAAPPEPTEETTEPEEPVIEEADVDKARFDELAGLFARLRSPDPAVKAEDRATEEATEEHAEPPAAPLPPRPAGSDSEAFDLRERLLLPVTNRALRNLKRQLTEEQNLVLEDIRLRELDWEPSAEAVAERVNADLVVLVAEAFAAGHAAAEELTGSSLKRPQAPRETEFSGFAAALAEELRHVREEALAVGQGARQLSAAVSRVFRGWRTDEAERRVRDLARSFYHRGLAESVGEVRWVVGGRGCATCRAAAEEEHPTGVPPAHPECACTVVPA